MKVQKYERDATPLNERIRYFFETMFWLIVTLFVFVALLVTFWNIAELFVPTGRYTGHPAFTEDRMLCLDTRPRSELYDCLGEYGWFDTPAKIQLGN
jgi:hypothetical protein